MLKRISLVVLIIFFISGGINHFVNPDFYLPLIPPYFPFPSFINIMSGVAEVVLGAGLIFSATRKYAAWGLIILLLAFIPTHIYFIQLGGCIADELCVPEWIGWVRLVVIHPLLLCWIAWHRK